MQENKLLRWIVAIILILTFLEISFYFFYIFKPIDRLFGRDLEIPKGIPTFLEILTPSFVSEYFTPYEGSKTLFNNRIESFTNDLRLVMYDKSQFVTSAEANYSVAGTVNNIKINKTNDLLYSDYSIYLRNSVGLSFEEQIKASEMANTHIAMINVGVSNYSTEKKNMEDIKVNDYLIIKRTTNLLNPSGVDIEIVILRRSN